MTVELTVPGSAGPAGSPGSPELVVRDHGGPADGPGVVLLHGFGGNALHWEEFAPLLTDRFRVVAPDLRCHGRSGDGPWDWDALVSDVARVAARVGFERPAVVGHSLGGGIAAWWARQHPDCPGAVDLDGTRAVETAPENYPGLDSSVAAAQLAQLTAAFEAQAAAMAGPLTDVALDAMREQVCALRGPSAVETVERNLVRTDNGETFVRPSQATVETFRADMDSYDLFKVLAEARCPLLVCTATRNLPGTEPFTELLSAHRRGVSRDLAAVAADNPLLRIEPVPASHNLVHEIPEQVAALVGEFLLT
ncbi:alpha/beta fold hydrolase [Flindersiella endophytica]